MQEGFSVKLKRMQVCGKVAILGTWQQCACTNKVLNFHANGCDKNGLVMPQVKFTHVKPCKASTLSVPQIGGQF